jgi:hypothetical protein
MAVPIVYCRDCGRSWHSYRIDDGDECFRCGGENLAFQEEDRTVRTPGLVRRGVSAVVGGGLVVIRSLLVLGFAICVGLGRAAWFVGRRGVTVARRGAVAGWGHSSRFVRSVWDEVQGRSGPSRDAWLLSVKLLAIVLACSALLIGVVAGVRALWRVW